MMGEKSTECKHLIAKRKKQFISVLLCALFAVMPTVDTLADTTEKCIVENKNWKIAVGAEIKSDEYLYSTEITSGNALVVTLYDGKGNNEKIEGKYDGSHFGVRCNDRREKTEIGNKIKTSTISDFDHWKVIDLKKVKSIPDSNGFSYYVDLQAVLSKAKVTVSSTEGGSAEPGKAEVTKDDVNKTVSLTATPAEGYDFEKWEKVKGNIELADTTSANASFKVLELYDDIEIKASFKKKDGYKITLDPAGGKVSPTTITTDSMGKLAELPTPTYEGNDFIGWYDDDGVEVGKDHVFTKDTTIHARWTNTPVIGAHTVSFDPNGGTVSPKSMTTGDDGKLKNKLPVPEYEGRNFRGWYNEKTGEKVTDDTVYSEDTTLVAHWDDDSDPTPTPGHFRGPRHSSDDGDTIDNTPAAKVNPDAIAAYYYVNGVLQTNAIIGKQEQSALATSVFKAAVPAGWNWAFPMSMSYNGKNEYSLKNGTIKLYVPAAYQKSGRQFAFLAMDKNGKVILLPDQDVLENTVTVTPNIEGYAYVLIYKD